MTGPESVSSMTVAGNSATFRTTDYERGGGGLRAFDLQAWRHSIVDELFLFISDKTEQCHVILWNVISALLHESGSDINNNADKFQCIECDEGGRLEPFGWISRTGTHRIIYREPRNPPFGWSKGLIYLWSNVKTTVRMIEKQDPCCLKDTTHPPTTVLIYIHVYNSLYIHNHSRKQTNHLKMPKWTRDTKIILIFWNRALVEIQSNY